MSGYLLDTNVVSELRKGARAEPSVRRWYRGVPAEQVFLSVLVIGEIERGVLSIARRDPEQAQVLTAWLDRVVSLSEGRILPVTEAIARQWARLMVPDPRPVIDALLAATAATHQLTLATRNTADFDGLGVELLSPFETEA